VAFVVVVVFDVVAFVVAKVFVVVVVFAKVCTKNCFIFGWSLEAFLGGFGSLAMCLVPEGGVAEVELHTT
jgi:hypothetical protein